MKRQRRDGSIRYTARVQIQKAGKRAVARAQTFDREAAAKIWIAKNETEVAARILSQARQATLRRSSDRPIHQAEPQRDGQDQGPSPWPKSLAQVLGAGKNYGIADLDCADLRSSDIADLATEFGTGGRLLNPRQQA